MPEHQICLGFMPFFACICFVLQLLTGFCMCRLLCGRDRRPAHISWPICCIHIYPGQGARAHDMCILVFMMNPGANTSLFIAHYNCSGVPRAILGALPRTTLSLQRCRSSLFWPKLVIFFFLFTTFRRACQDTTTYRRSARLSFSRSQVHVCLHALLVPAFLECAWTLRFSPLLLFTSHKAVFTCLLKVFLTIHTSRRACLTPACDRQRLRQRIERSDI